MQAKVDKLRSDSDQCFNAGPEGTPSHAVLLQVGLLSMPEISFLVGVATNTS